jgi:hypothetical protein
VGLDLGALFDRHNDPEWSEALANNARFMHVDLALPRSRLWVSQSRKDVKRSE